MDHTEREPAIAYDEHGAYYAEGLACEICGDGVAPPGEEICDKCAAEWGRAARLARKMADHLERFDAFLAAEANEVEPLRAEIERALGDGITVEFSHTGGGCTALEITRVDLPTGYVLVTDNEDANVTSSADLYAVWLYESDGDGIDGYEPVTRADLPATILRALYGVCSYCLGQGCKTCGGTGAEVAQ